MAATATEAKPKASKSIVTTRLTANGIKHALAKSAHGQLERAYELIALLCKVPAWEEKANSALETVGELVEATRDSK